jgi:hypothetical protein
MTTPDKTNTQKKRSGWKDSQILLAGLLFSIVFHLTFLLPLVVDISDEGEKDRLIELASAIEPPPMEPEPEEPILGIDESMAKTMNWIGYEEYEEHLARLSENDQAAFDLTNSGGGGAPPSTPENAAAESIKEQATRKSELAPPTVTANTPEDPNNPQAPKSDVLKDAPKIETKDNKKNEPEAKGKDAEKSEGEAETKETEKAAEEAPAEESPKPEKTPKPSEPKPPAPEPKPAPQEGPGSGEGEPGNSTTPADRESDATSVIEVPRELWNRGRPLAAQGVELQTRRPMLDTLTQLNARFGNPLVEINFARNGRPTSAKILESSGDIRLDEPILDSLYRWRAKGKKLQELEGDATFDVKLRILLK